MRRRPRNERDPYVLDYVQLRWGRAFVRGPMADHPWWVYPGMMRGLF